MDYAIKLPHGDGIRVSADNYSVHGSGALAFINGIGKKAQVLLVLAPGCWERLQPIPPQPKMPAGLERIQPAPAKTAARKASRRATK